MVEDDLFFSILREPSREDHGEVAGNNSLAAFDQVRTEFVHSVGDRSQDSDPVLSGHRDDILARHGSDFRSSTGRMKRSQELTLA